MTTLLSRGRVESGQVIVFVAFILTALVGMAALVIDVGSWYRADRHLQTAADAAALASAQELPTKPSTAVNVAMDYGTVKNGAGLAALSVNPSIPRPDTIHVSATAEAPGFFARVISAAYNEVTVRAEAEAQVFSPSSLKNVAPIAVKNTASCIVSNPSCFGPDNPVTLNFDESNIGSSLMGLINVKCNSDSSSGCGPGRTGGDEEREMIECDPCNSAALPSNKWYGVKTGGTYGPVGHGLEYAAANEMTLLFPVFDKSCPGDPSCAGEDKSFHIIGWAAFVINPDGVNWPGGSNKVRTLTGYFVTFIATDLASGGTLPDPDVDFGVHVITLTH